MSTPSIIAQRGRTAAAFMASMSCTIQVGGTPVRWTDEEAIPWQ